MLLNGCYSKKVVTVNPIPSFGGSDSGCTMNIMTLAVEPGGGTWSSTNPALATITSAGANTGSITGIAPGLDTFYYTSLVGCTNFIAYRINKAVLTSISISDTPNTTQCFGTPIYFSSGTTNAGQNKTLQWTVNGSVVATGDSFTFMPNNGDIVKCILISDTLCATPNPNTSNALVMSVIKHTPSVQIASTYGDTSCIGLPNTYWIIASDTGALPVVEWDINHTPTAFGVTSYSFVPHNGDIVSVSILVDLPCAKPNPAVATDSVVVDNYQTPTVQLDPLTTNAVCQGNTITIYPFGTWTGWTPVFNWFVNGIFASTGADYTYFPNNGDTVSCIMVSNYLCLTTDSASNKIGIVVDPVIIVDVTGKPGVLIPEGGTDTLTANVVNGGIDPSYQWLINGIPVPGANYRTFIHTGYSNKDSVTCVVTTGYGTPCQGVQGYNWMILAVAPLGIENQTLVNSNLQITPNPNSGDFVVEGNVGSQNSLYLVITDLLGRVICSKKAITKNGTLNEQFNLGTEFSSGVYFLRAIGNGFRASVKFNLYR